MVVRLPPHRHPIDDIYPSVAVEAIGGALKDTKKVDFTVGPNEDYTTIDEALAALPSDGGSLGLKSKFTISSPIVVDKPNVSLLGNGRDKTLIKGTHNGNILQIGSGIVNTVISDLTLQGISGKDDTVNTTNFGIYLQGCSRIAIRNVDVKDCYVGIFDDPQGVGQDTWHNIFYQGRISNCVYGVYGDDPPAAGADGTNILLRDVWIDTMDFGIRIGLGNAFVLEGVQILNPDTIGIEIKANHGESILLNTQIDNCGSYALNLPGSAGSEITFIVVQGCWLKSIGTQAVKWEYVDRSKIIDSTFISKAECLKLSYCDGNIFADNRYIANAGATVASPAISLANSTFNSFSGGVVGSDLAPGEVYGVVETGGSQNVAIGLLVSAYTNKFNVNNMEIMGCQHYQISRRDIRLEPGAGVQAIWLLNPGAPDTKLENRTDVIGTDDGMEIGIGNLADSYVLLISSSGLFLKKIELKTRQLDVQGADVINAILVSPKLSGMFDFQGNKIKDPDKVFETVQLPTYIAGWMFIDIGGLLYKIPFYTA